MSVPARIAKGGWPSPRDPRGCAVLFANNELTVYSTPLEALPGSFRVHIDLGDVDEQAQLAAHLAERGLALDDVWAVASKAVPRRKGNRIYLHGRGTSGAPLVIVLNQVGSGWRPRTGWQMDRRERKWWRARGGV